MNHHSRQRMVLTVRCTMEHIPQNMQNMMGRLSRMQTPRHMLSCTVGRLLQPLLMLRCSLPHMTSQLSLQRWSSCGPECTTAAAVPPITRVTGSADAKQCVEQFRGAPHPLSLVLWLWLQLHIRQASQRHSYIPGRRQRQSQGRAFHLNATVHKGVDGASTCAGSAMGAVAEEGASGLGASRDSSALTGRVSVNTHSTAEPSQCACPEPHHFHLLLPPLKHTQL